MPTYPAGSIFVLSDLLDSIQGDAIVLNGANGATLASLAGYPNASQGDRLPSGVFAVTVEAASPIRIIGVNLYNADLTLLSAVRSIPIPTDLWNTDSPLISNQGDRFYVATKPITGSDDSIIYTVTAAGVVGMTTWTLSSPGPSKTLQVIAPTPDNTILYWGASNGAANLGVIHRWDLVHDAALADLVAMGSSVIFGKQMFVVSGGDVIVMVSPDTTNFEVRRYTSAGVLVRTYALGAAASFDTPEMFLDIDPLVFWVRAFYDATDAHSTFLKIDLATGTTLLTFLVADLDGGGTVPTTCPVIVLGETPIASVPTPPWPITPPFSTGGVPTGALEFDPNRRLRRSPHLSEEQFRIFYHRFQLDLQPGIGNLTGLGIHPTVMLRWSNDGGYTWSNEVELSAGAQGDYTKRVYALALGSGRDRVFEVSVSDPVTWVLIAAFLEVSKGTS